MMGPLVTVFFLLLFSGTTVLGHKPRKQCDFLRYEDIEKSQPTPSFTNKASLNGKLVYQYDSDSGKAKPGPGYDNVEDWNQVSQYQKNRGDYAWENLQEIMDIKKDASDSHVLKGLYGCELCENGDTNAFWEYFFDGKPFIKFNKEIPAWIPEDPAANQIKRKWEKDPGAVNRAKEYLEKTCIEDLKKYRDYKKSN